MIYGWYITDHYLADSVFDQLSPMSEADSVLVKQWVTLPHSVTARSYIVDMY